MIFVLASSLARGSPEENSDDDSDRLGKSVVAAAVVDDDVVGRRTGTLMNTRFRRCSTSECLIDKSYVGYAEIIIRERNPGEVMHAKKRRGNDDFARSIVQLMGCLLI